MAGLFDSIVQATLVHEGSGLNTRGGEYSKFGINKKHNKDVDIENLTADKAKEIYRKKYWEKPRINDLLDESTNIAAKVFDTGVNQGQGRSIKMLQSVLRELGQDIKVDGIIGPKTEKALENALSNYGEGDILNRLSSLQLARYQSLSSYEANKGGWDNRAAWTPDFPKEGYTGFAMEGFGTPQPLKLGEPTGEYTPEGRPLFLNNRGTKSSEYSTGVKDERINNKALTHIPSIYDGRILNDKDAAQRVVDAGGYDPLTGRFIEPGGDPNARSGSLQSIPHHIGGATTDTSRYRQQRLPSLEEAAAIAQVQPALDPFPWLRETYDRRSKVGMYPPKKMFKSRSMYPPPKK